MIKLINYYKSNVIKRANAKNKYQYQYQISIVEQIINK